MLVGTQMVAKGHDFDGVALGVVLDADATLRFPDFRAEERTFALIAQLAGRAGRGGAGQVLVQTIAPEARAIGGRAPRQRRLPGGGARATRGALPNRRSHTSSGSCAGPREQPARGRPGGAAGALRPASNDSLGHGDATVLGPAALFRLRGLERRVLVIKARERRDAVAATGDAVQHVWQTTRRRRELQRGRGPAVSLLGR